MKRLLVLALAIGFAGNLLSLFTVPQLAAQAKGKTRPLTTSQMMAGLVKPKFVELKEGLAKEKLKDADWKGLTTHAALLCESSYIMMDDGRCPDKVWEESAVKLRKAAHEVLARIAEKDAPGAQKAFEGIANSCKMCHAEHKYKKAVP